MIFNVTVDNVLASVSDLQVLTAGMVNGRAVQFSFSSEWNNLNKTAVFTNGIDTKIVPEYKWENGVAYIPPEVLAVPHHFVRCGVYGINENNEVVIPTLWVDLGRVFPSASPGEYTESVPPTPNTWDDLQNQIGVLSNLNTQEKANLVKAINECLAKGIDTEAVKEIVKECLSGYKFDYSIVANSIIEKLSGNPLFIKEPFSSPLAPELRVAVEESRGEFDDMTIFADEEVIATATSCKINTKDMYCDEKPFDFIKAGDTCKISFQITSMKAFKNAGIKIEDVNGKSHTFLIPASEAGVIKEFYYTFNANSKYIYLGSNAYSASSGYSRSIQNLRIERHSYPPIQKFSGKNYALTDELYIPVGTGTVYITSDRTKTQAKGFLDSPLKLGHTYTITMNISGGHPTDKIFILKNFDSTTKKFSTLATFNEDGRVSTTITIDKFDCENLYFYAHDPISEAKEYEATFSNITICEGEPTIYTADENGNVSGIIANGESMTLISDSDVTISAEYNVDTKKYIDKKFAELQALVLEV